MLIYNVRLVWTEVLRLFALLNSAVSKFLSALEFHKAPGMSLFPATREHMCGKPFSSFCMFKSVSAQKCTVSAQETQVGSCGRWLKLQRARFRLNIRDKIPDNKLD